MAAGRVSLIGRDGQPLAVAALALVAPPQGSDADVRFFSWSDLSRLDLRLDPDDRATLSSLRLTFLGCGETEVWNSWLRAPRLPRPGLLQLQIDGQAVAFREARFAVAARPVAPPQLHHDAVLIELGFPPCQPQLLSVQLPPGPYALLRVQTASLPYRGVPFPARLVPDLPSYPPSRADLAPVGDPLAAELTGIEPTLAALWQRALPFRGGALLGQPTASIDADAAVAYQLWDGGLLVRPAPDPAAERPLQLGGGLGDRVLLRLELDPPQPLRSCEQQLVAGFLPVGEVRLVFEGLTLTQRAFVDERSELRLSLRVQTTAATLPPGQLRLSAIGSRRQVAENDRTLHAEIHTPLPLTRRGERLELSDPQRSLQSDVLLPLTAAQEQVFSLRLPLAGSPSTAPSQAFALALDRLRTQAQDFLQRGTSLQLPDPQLQKLWQALLLQVPLFMRRGVLLYGRFPSVYDGGLFGVEEGWDLVALAQLGHAELALASLRRTFFDPEFLQKDGPHHQYRNGLAITYALDISLLGGMGAALHDLWPQITASAEWIRDSLRSTRTLLPDGPRPPHYGLMPKHIYGGDLRRPAYSLYATSTCWRGLRDAARVAAIIGDAERQRDFQTAADQARADFLQAAATLFRRDGKPPYLPFATDEAGDRPDSGDYYQLFASLILETAVLGWRGEVARQLTGYLQDTGRLLAGVPRFDGWFGRLGIDAEYARGAQLAALQRREFDRFYLGLLAQVALSCDPYTFVSPETAVVLFTQAEYQDRLRALSQQGSRADSDPCSAGTGVMLQYLRLLLACEERDEDDLPTGTLWLGAAAPASWFAAGQSFGCDRLPTLHGSLSYRCRSDAARIVYEISTSAAIKVEVFAYVAGQRLSKSAVVYPRAELVFDRAVGI